MWASKVHFKVEKKKFIFIYLSSLVWNTVHTHTFQFILFEFPIIMLTFIFLVLVFFTVEGTTRIGRINSAAYVSPNITNVLSYNGTCDECICQAFFKNMSSNYQGLNCFENQTCLLFTVDLSSSMIQIDVNSTFVFKQIPTQSKLFLFTIK